jgi:hypothetical protein
VYDLLAQDYDYVVGGQSGQMPFLGDVVSRSGDETTAREEAAARRRFSLMRSYRVGVSYRVPSVFFLDDVAVAVDHQGYRSGEQALLARTHAGVRAEVVGPLRLRAGLSAGYPSAGLGVELGALHLDYAVHGVEEGRRAGQLRTYVHTARVLLRLE